MRNIFFLIFSMLLIQTHAQEVSVSGVAHGSNGDLVQVLVYADQFSMLEKSIGETFSDSSGLFSIKAPLTETTYGYLALNGDKGEFYLTPKAVYDFDVLLQEKPSQGSVFDKIPLQFSLQSDRDGGLQTDIGLFNQQYNSFIYENAQAIYRSRSKKVIDDFKKKMQIQFHENKNAYFQEYVNYSFLSLDWLSKRMSDEKVVAELVNQPVLYQNIQYTEFFKTFFDNYLEQQANKHYDEMIYVLNQSREYDELQVFVERDSLLKTNQQVSELVMMLLMSKFYHVADIRKSGIIEKYRLLSKKSRFVQNRKIALHFIEKLTQLDYGFQAPSFVLLNQKGDSVDLKNYIGKFVLLNFVGYDCQICVSDLEKLKKIKENLADSLSIITLVVEPSIGRPAPLSIQSDFQWEFLSVPKHDLLPQKYQVRTFPTYVLINPDGSMAYSTMPMPDENMELMIKRFMRRFSE